MRALIVMSFAGLSACASGSTPRAGDAATAAADSVAWSAGAPLPTGRDHHVTFITSRGSNSYLWVAGGNDYKRTMEEVSKMEHAYATHATALHDGAVWLFGGVEDNARFVDVVLRAPFTADGKLGPG